MKWNPKQVQRLLELYDSTSYEKIAKVLNKEFKTNHTANACRKAYERYKYPVVNPPEQIRKPKILVFDIETLPMEAYVWSMYQEVNNTEMIIEDWSVLSWAAKWYGEDEVFYDDVRMQKNLRDDKRILKGIWKLLNEADFVVAHNGNKFDIRKLNARFIEQGMEPPSSYKRFDTRVLARKHFGFTSNKLSELTKKLCTKYKKDNHSKYPGFSMWKECIARNMDAFDHMEKYNKLDVLSLEELFERMLPWENATLFNLYHDTDEMVCTCGSTEFKKNGYYYTNASKFQKYKCVNCGSEARDNINLIPRSKKKLKPTTR